MSRTIEVMEINGDVNAATPFAPLGAYMRDLKEAIDMLGAIKTEYQNEFDRIRRGVLPDKMEAEQMSTITLPGVGRITVTDQMSASILPEYKLDMQAWLKDNGFGALVTATVNASTLSAFVKEQMGAGNDLPYDFLNISTYRQASLTKK